MKIWLDERKGLVLGRAKWTGGTINICKTIGGFRYLKRTQTASWPLTMGTLYRLRDAFGESLEVDHGLYRWARMQRKRDANGTDLAQIAPELAEAINNRPYQVRGVSRIATQKALGLFDEPSLGKTLQSLAGLMVAGEWNGRHLVICPKTAINITWGRQIAAWTDGQVFPITGTASQKRSAIQQFLDAGRGPRIAITNPETLRIKMDQRCDRCERWKNELRDEEHEGRTGHQLRWRICRQDYPELFGITWDSIIADECDRYLLALRPHTNGRMPDWGEGMVRLAADRKIAMTGTPFHGSEVNMFGILHWLDPQRFDAFWTHIDQYFEQQQTHFGREIIGIRADSRQAYEELLDMYTLRRTKYEVKPDLPAELHQDHFIDMSPIQRRAYEEFEELGWTKIEGDALRSRGILAQIVRLQQLAFGEMMIRGNKLAPVRSEKYEWLLAALSERGIKVKGVNTGHMKYVIVSQFTFILNWISEQFDRAGIKHLMITGDVTGERRGNAVALFQSYGDPHRVMLLNTKAGGVSIDLDAWCDEMFILDETDVEDEMEQVRGRINNRGERVAPRTFHYVRTADTIQERMADKALRQALMQHQLLDGRRGLELAARLLGRQL